MSFVSSPASLTWAAMSAPPRNTRAKFAEALAMRFVAAQSVQPVRDRVRAVLIGVVIERHSVALRTDLAQTLGRSPGHVSHAGNMRGTHPAAGSVRQSLQ